jgi:hypothetical protein
MKTIYTYYKNSNTGEVMKSQEFTETSITGIPIYFYGLDGMGIGENLETKGFVKISEKKWDRIKRKGNLSKNRVIMKKQKNNEKNT